MKREDLDLKSFITFITHGVYETLRNYHGRIRDYEAQQVRANEVCVYAPMLSVYAAKRSVMQIVINGDIIHLRTVYYEDSLDMKDPNFRVELLYDRVLSILAKQWN